MATTSTQVAAAYKSILLSDPPGGAGGAYATAVATQINDGLTSLGNFEASLIGLPQTMYTTLPALVTIDAFYGATPTLDTLTTAATATSGTSYDSALELHNLGYSDANVWTIMGADWGADKNSQFYQLYNGMATGNAADYQTFIDAVYQREFGTLPTQANLQNLLNDIPGVQQLLNGGGHTATAIQVMGGLFGYLLYAGQTNSVGTYTAPATTFLSTAALDEAAAPGSSASLYGGADFLKIPGIGPVTTVVTQSYLKPGTDNVTANNIYGDLSPFQFNGVGPTLNSEDTLNGSPGSTDNTLTVTDGFNTGQDILPAGVTINNIQNVVLQTAGNAGAGGAPLDVSPFASVTQLKVTSAGAGADVVNGGTNAAVTIQHNNSTGGVQVTGGSAVSITTAGAGPAIGSALGSNDGDNDASVVVGQFGLPTSDPTGAVSITDTAAQTANGDGGDIYVYGGSSVSVAATNATYNGEIDIGDAPNQQPTGAVSVTDAGQGSSVNVYGGTDVAVTEQPALAPSAGGQNGNVVVGDITGNYQQPSGTVTVTQQAKVAYDGLGGAAHNNTVSGNVQVYGGTDVTVASNAGGGITIGSPAKGTANPVAPSGTVTVTDTSADLNGAFGIGNYNADGVLGTTINGGPTASANVIAEGADVTVNLASSSTSGPVHVTEQADASNSKVTGVSWQTITVDGGNGVAVTAQGQTVNIGTNAGAGGAQVVNQSAVLTGAGLGTRGGVGHGAVTVDGGASVNVTTTGGNVTVGGTPAGSFASGPVVVTDTFGGANSDAISVAGGAPDANGNAVSITTSPTSGAITVGNAAPTKANLGQDPTGNVTIVDAQANGSSTVYGTGNVNVTTNGGSTVSIQGGAVQKVQDAQAALKGTSTLASVSLDGVQTGGNVTIASDALASLTITDNQVVGNDYIVTNNNKAAQSLALTVNNDSKAFTVQDNTAGTVTVGDNGSNNGKASTGTLTLTASKATGIAFNNGTALTANLAGDNAVKAVTATGDGSLNLLGLSGLAQLTSVDASTAKGGVTAEISGNTSFTGGSGVNTVTEDTNPANWGSGVKVNGGSGGSNTIVANYIAGAEILSSNVSNFQTLGLGQNAVGTFDATGFTAEQVSGTTNGNFSKVADGSTLTLENDAAAVGSGNTVVFFHKDLTSNSATIYLGLDNGTSAASKIGVNATGNIFQNVSTDSKTVTVNSAGYIGKSGGNVVTNTLQLNDGNLTTLNIGGDQATTINSGAAVTTIDASKSTGSTVDVSGVTGAMSGVTVTGGSGKLIAHGTMNGNAVANADVGLQQDTITLSGGFGAGDIVSATIGGHTYNYTVLPSDVQGLSAAAADAQVAKSMAAYINGQGPAGFQAAPNGANLVLTATTPGVGFGDVVNQPTLTNSIGEQTTTPNQVALAQADQFGIGGTWAAGDVASITVNGHLYSYTVTPALIANAGGGNFIATWVAIAQALAGVINGAAPGNGDKVSAAPTGIAQNGAALLNVTSTVPGTSFTDSFGVTSAGGGMTKTALQANVPAAAQVDTVTIGGAWGVGDTVSENINGNTYSYTVAATDEGASAAATNANIASKLAGVIGNANGALASAVATGNTIALTAATPGTPLANDTALAPVTTGSVTGPATTQIGPQLNYTGANDSFTVGTGGGQITLGAGGGWNRFLPNSATANPANAGKFAQFSGATDTGSETVNLGQETTGSTLFVNDGVISYFNGSKGGVNGFHIPTAAGGIADQITFANGTGPNNSASDPKSILANLATQTSVAAAIGALGLTAANVLDTTGALASALTNLSFTVSNGLIQFVGTGGQSLSNFTPSQLQQAAQLILDYGTINNAPYGGPNKVAAINTLGANGVSGTGDILIVASSAIPTIVGGVNGSDTNSVIDLRGLATSANSFAGFGTTAAANTVVVTDLAQNPLTDPHTGSAAKNTTYTTADKGLLQEDGFTQGAAGITNTYNDLAGSAQLDIGGGAAGNLVVNQQGVSGQESLTLNFTGPVKLASATVSGDNMLAITGASADTIQSLTDATNTVSTITIGANEAVTLDAISASALTSIKAGDAGVTLGDVTSLSQAGLKVTAGDGTNNISASGAGDTIGVGNGANTIVASGDGDAVSVGTGLFGPFNITANGAGDTISVGVDPHGVAASASGGGAIHASGAGDFITFNGTQTGAATVDGGDPTLGVGANATVTFANLGAGSEQVVLTGDTAGTTTAGSGTVSMTTLINALHAGAGGDSLVFSNAGNEVLAGNGMAGSQVNMSSILAQSSLSSSAMLNAALDLAASEDAASRGATGLIPANTGVLDWFQLNGNTYIVEATNKTTAPAAHTGLAAGDTVVKLAGLVNLNSSTFAGGVLHI